MRIDEYPFASAVLQLVLKPFVLFRPFGKRRAVIYCVKIVVQVETDNLCIAVVEREVGFAARVNHRTLALTMGERRKIVVVGVIIGESGGVYLIAQIGLMVADSTGERYLSEERFARIEERLVPCTLPTVVDEVADKHRKVGIEGFGDERLFVLPVLARVLMDIRDHKYAEGSILQGRGFATADCFIFAFAIAYRIVIACERL